MAVLVPTDWKPSMESPNTSRNRSPAGAPQTPPPNGVQPNPNQGPFNPAQPAWTPSPTAQPFYPQFYPQNPGVSPSHSPQIPPGQGPPGQGGPPPPQPQFMPGPHPGMGGPMPGPYFDPNANAQFAQWYHHMMLAQQQATMQAQMGGYPAPMPMQAGYPYPNGPQPGVPVPPFIAPQASRSNSHNSPQEYTGFHPYRRPTRGQSQDSMASAAASQQPGAPFPGVAPGMNGSAPIFQPPYARPDAAGSTSSVGSRPRTDSNRSANSGSGATRRSPAPPPPVPTPPPGRTGTPPQAAQVPSAAASKLAQVQGAHARQSSTASSATSKGPTSSKAPSSSSATTATTPASIASTAAARTPRPSPLSQGQSGGPERELSKAEKRMSRDDSDLAALRDPSAGGRSAGLKGRLRKAFTTLQEEEKEVNERERLSQSSAAGGGANASHNQNVIPPRAPTPAPGPSMARSMSTPAIVDMDSGLGGDGKKKRSIFNSKFNRSTDNISISSVSSSASVMIRKLGSLGKLARRNSIAGITSLFKKDKDGDGDDDGEGGKSGKKDKKKDKKDKEKDKKGKGAVAEAQVSHATAELEAGEWSAEMTGLSPAARLARQHTLKSNAEAAARAKEAEAAALAEKERAAAAQGNGVPVWDRNTATRAQAEGLKRVGEDGRHDDSYNSDDDDGTEEGMYRPGGQGPHEYAADAWDDQDDDHSWAEAEVEADDTIRQGLARVSIDDRSAFNHAADPHDWPADEEPWAVGLRRSVERSAVPLRGILKNADNYDQQVYLEQAAGGGLTARHRSNSYGGMTGVMGAQPEPGPLARIPSPDPDHIDGLQRVGSVSSGSHHSTHAAPNPVNGESPPFLPAFAFEGAEGSPVTASPTTSSHTMVAPPTPEKSIYNLPNSSAPALTQFSGTPAPLLTHRAVTAPPKKLSFAANLSVYDTFPATLYDRRSEPATASRLTPALAQRIKEELNSFKMEEMEVHAASRIHTQFFV